ncbi:MAG: homogentisate 1,2-dioxygenase [Bacteroidetes bacterium]|jgi:homogentisate 1,2-dioxygenase|nr:homogentisate 1,2-dioxygenase [Bacteroidota bacterium]MBK9352953.1 homogentisate 1,2-dioxygenase [Bacteroidota bacterium]MBK9633189.1 homogentisate 1,2-dioxygenase [Bacteroidota bacterium]MBL0077647.1 homogentisate 1,2-dioxygenase [Bacteroidota bacterium]
MAYYISQGKIPHKRHTIFKNENGDFIYEQLFGNEGFSGKSSLLYHLHRPTQINSIGESLDLRPKAAVNFNILPRKLEGFLIPQKDDFIDSKTCLFFNNSVEIGMAFPKKSTTAYFLKNADADELLFIHKGKGHLSTLFGEINFEYGDYLVIPKGVIYQIFFETEDNKILFVESKDEIKFPSRYINEYGQLLEHSPFCERDLKTPNFIEPKNEKGNFLIKIKKQGILHEVNYATHPFDVVGWDGCLYPYGLSIHDFEPITGRVHQPPPVHQTFGTKSFVICSFVPRLFDYHPEAIPAPYNHSNIESEELLYYVDGDFMSRNNIRPGQFTLHPGGIPHGPAPGSMERSIGQKETNELAVMIDTFKPLQLTATALGIEDINYAYSWIQQ